MAVTPSTPAPDVTALSATADGGATVYRRRHLKRDGRTLFLYGYEPHDLPVQAEDPGVSNGAGEMRFHPLRREWNIYAPHRQGRTFKPSAADDPLAPTQPGGPATEIPFTDFEIAVFENKFTSLREDAPSPDPNAVPGVTRAAATGHCDVVVYTPEGAGSLHSVGQARRRLLLAAWTDRYQALFAQGADFVLPFENRGDAVGVTLHHPHGQIYAFGTTPAVQQQAARSFADGYDLCAEMDAWDDYVVCEAGGLVALCPPFARFPFETWIVPRRAVRGPWAFDDTQSDGFAHLLGEMTRRLDAHFGVATPFMLNLQAAPQSAERWQFTARFLPLLRAPGRVKYLASVEQSTGLFTVDVMPEQAAKTLRALA